MSTIKSYIKQVLAQLKGDQDAVTAEQNYRTAKATVKGQLAALEAKLVKEEIAVDKAKENLIKAKYPTTPIQDGELYLANIQSAQHRLDSAESNLADTKHSIQYFEELAEEFDKDEAAA